ncbi:hypothetical protein B4W76_12375, partial [Staphylococcus intermedius]
VLVCCVVLVVGWETSEVESGLSYDGLRSVCVAWLCVMLLSLMDNLDECFLTVFSTIGLVSLGIGFKL